MTSPIRSSNTASHISLNTSKTSQSKKLNNPELQDMTKVDIKNSGITRFFNNVSNFFRSIGKSVNQANEKAPITMPMTVKNLGIAVNPERAEPLNKDGIQTLSNHIDTLETDKKEDLIASAIKDVEKGGHNLLKLLNRNPTIFQNIITSSVKKGGGKLIQSIITHSKKLPMSLLSAVSSYTPKNILELSTPIDNKVDFNTGTNLISNLFERGGMSMHQALESIKALISADIDGAMDITGKESMPEIFASIRGMVEDQGSSELKDGLAIRKQFETLSKPGETAGAILDNLTTGLSLKIVADRDLLNTVLTSVDSALTFTGDAEHDKGVMKHLKTLSKQTGAGSGGDEMIFNQFTTQELKELKEMASFADGQKQIESRLNSYSGSTPEAASTIASACMKTFLETRPVDNPKKTTVTKSDVKKLIKTVDKRLSIFQSVTNAWQKKFSPEQYTNRKLNKLTRLVNTIQTEVDANRLEWNKETKQAAIEMVSQKLQKYTSDLDAMAKADPDFQKELMYQASALLEKIEKVIVPESQFESLTPEGTFTADHMEIGDQHYSIGELIGQGSFGKVHRCVNDKTGEKGVVKFMLVSEMTVETIDALREVYTTQQFEGHRHIISPTNVAITAMDENEMQKLAIIMPEADQGDMEQVVDQLADKPLEERTPIYIRLLADAADGLTEMHQKGFSHRDINPGNIFVTTNNLGDSVGMLGDLGISQHKSTFDSLDMSGTQPYMPSDSSVSLSVDSYAFGMMTFELLSGGSFPFLDTPETVFDEKSDMTMPEPDVLKTRINERLSTASDDLKLLIFQSLSATPEQRPTMTEWRATLARSL